MFISTESFYTTRTMTLFFRPAAALLVFFLLFLPSAQASELSAADYQHAQNAFLFVDRGGWRDALLHAKRARNPLVIKTVQWLYYKEKDSGASFDEIIRFQEKNPHWPGQDTLKLRAEEALVSYSPSPAAVRSWFQKHPPITGKGKIFYVQMMGSHVPREKVASLVREAWKDGDFDEVQERAILTMYREFLRPEDHAARADRLLWQEKTKAAERMLPYVSAEVQALVKARSALIRDTGNVQGAVNQVPARLRKDPGLIYDRMRWRDRQDLEEGVEEMLRAAPENVPYPEKWWRLRERHIRQALIEGRIQDAASLLKNHSQLDGKSQADALWLSGWVTLEFLKKPREAYPYFYALFNNVKFPVSKSRGAYWAGKAAALNGNPDTAANWFKQAAAYPTTFYGQLAILELSSRAPLLLPAEHVPTPAEQRAFEERELVRVIYMLDEAKQSKLASALILHLIDTATNAADYALSAELGMRMRKPHHSVRAAKRALQKGYMVIETGYPHYALPPALPLEPALALAIIRQESEFDRFARSPSNALGMMQLLPGTGKEVSRKLGLAFSPTKLFDPDYNIRLGSTYLSRVINGFDGSYIQGIAAYNAGPGRVRQWRSSFGVPPKNVEGAIRWIEMIPFEETRNYVQRVLENLQIYRHFHNGGKTPYLQLRNDLVR